MLCLPFPVSFTVSGKLQNPPLSRNCDWEDSAHLLLIGIRPLGAHRMDATGKAGRKNALKPGNFGVRRLCKRRASVGGPGSVWGQVFFFSFEEEPEKNRDFQSRIIITPTASFSEKESYYVFVTKIFRPVCCRLPVRGPFVDSLFDGWR